MSKKFKVTWDESTLKRKSMIIEADDKEDAEKKWEEFDFSLLYSIEDFDWEECTLEYYRNEEIIENKHG
jgi:hypothetical protein